MNRNVQPQDPFRQAFYPLTLPLTVGPGSISVAITLGANAAHHHQHGINFLAILAALIGSVLLALSIFLCYGFADRLARIIGPTAMTVIMRLSAFLLVCIGVQIVWNGISALLILLADDCPLVGAMPEIIHERRIRRCPQGLFLKRDFL